MTIADPAHAIPAAAQLRRSRRRWRIFAFVALALAVLALAGRFAFIDRPLSSHIARVELSGAIQTDRARTRLLNEIGEDGRVAAVILDINSPGGSTAGGEELYESLRLLSAKKPVVAVIDEMGASAAYMAAIGTDRIFARRLSLVGSIGVLYQHVDAGKLLGTIGIDLDKVASGPLKAEPDFDEPIAPEVRVALEQLVGDSFNWFVDIVAERRGLERPAALALADGRIFTGRMAADARLIDAIGGEADAEAWLVAERGLAEGIEVVTHEPRRNNGWGPFGALAGWGRGVLGLPAEGPIALDGLISLWQAGQGR